MFLLGVALFMVLQLVLAVGYFAVSIMLIVLYSLTCGFLSVVSDFCEENVIFGLLIVLLFPLGMLISLGKFGH